MTNISEYMISALTNAISFGKIASKTCSTPVRAKDAHVSSSSEGGGQKNDARNAPASFTRGPLPGSEMKGFSRPVLGTGGCKVGLVSAEEELIEECVEEKGRGCGGVGSLRRRYASISRKVGDERRDALLVV